MGSGYEGYDGTPLQPGACEADHALTNHDSQFSMIGHRECVIVGVRYTDDSGSRSRAYVEYECRDLHTGEVYTNVRRLEAMGGMTDGDDNVMRVQQQIRPGARSSKLTRFTRANDTDGDRVLVAFIGGARSRGVIVGVLTHSYAQYGAKTSDGERRLTTHKGTSVEIKSNGEYVVTHKSGTVLHLMDNGDVVIQAKGNIIADPQGNTGDPVGKVIMAEADTSPVGEGVVVGTGVDPFTGATYNTLTNASTRVFAKK
jgi:phage gp45-like